jgi:macrolide transport system ATP-binding/permease protein
MFLSVADVSKSYGVQQILAGVSLTLGAGQRIGLVGANGVGKSTLLKIIAGEIEADGGQIMLPTSARLGYLPQVIEAMDGKRIDDLIGESMAHITELETQMRQLEVAMGTAQGNALDEVMDEYGQVMERFEWYGGYELDYRVDMVFEGLGIGHLGRERMVESLSGGEKARVGLGILLLGSPDVLLLDEPTNHLDFASLEWLEGYLREYRGGVLIVSHDRHFLNRTVNAIVEIEEHSREAKHYVGDYELYLQVKAQERSRWEVEYVNQQAEIKELRHEIKVKARQVAHNRPPTDGDKFLKHFKRGKVEQAVSRRVQSAEERLKRIEDDPIPPPPDVLQFDTRLEAKKLEGHTPLSVSGLGKRYGAREVLTDVSFTLDAGSRIALVGPNGAGKSTLLKILTGIEEADSGEMTFNPQVTVGYMDQAQATLDGEAGVFEAFSEGLSGNEQQLKAILFNTGLFDYEETLQSVGQLSSGQKRKLQIARLIAEQANLLLLDEPTNFVSFDVLENFEGALKGFEGAIIAASHDRRFLEQFEGEVWEIRDGRLIQYLGGYEEYVQETSGERELVEI